MHFLYYVAVKKGKEKRTSQDLQNAVENTLTSNGFSGDGGYWGNSKSDWFVIGGRWSGVLAEMKLDNFHKKASKLIKSKRTKKGADMSFFTEDECNKYEKELQKLWEDLGGKGKNTWNRSGSLTIVEPFHEDNAMELDEKLFEGLKKKHLKGKEERIWGYTEVALLDENDFVEEEMPVKDFLKLKDIVGNYYMVVVDYHN